MLNCSSEAVTAYAPLAFLSRLAFSAIDVLQEDLKSQEALLVLIIKHPLRSLPNQATKASN